jgi:hypothetical protein
MCVVCQEGKNLVTVRFLVSAIMAPHLRAILAFIRMSIHHLRATLPLEVEDIPLCWLLRPSVREKSLISLLKDASLLK